jgi:hypothetical protein
MREVKELFHNPNRIVFLKFNVAMVFSSFISRIFSKQVVYK